MSVSRYGRDSDNNMDLLDDGIYVYYLDYSNLEDKVSILEGDIKDYKERIDNLERLMELLGI
jgi:hypothetical protein